jgi:Flp pilus assembly protein TadD
MRTVKLLVAMGVVLGLTVAAQAASREAIKHHNFGGELVKQGRLDEALGQFTRALELDPRYTHAQLSLAYTLDRLGRVGEAVPAYRKAIELDPGNVTAMNNLAVLHLKKGEHDEAIRALEQALEVEPGNASLRKNLETARANQRVLQERDDRIAEARRKAQAAPQDPEAAYHLARTLAFHFENDSALEWLAKALELGYPDPASWRSDPALTGLRADPRFVRLLDGQ